MDGNLDGFLNNLGKITGDKTLVRKTVSKIPPTKNPFDVESILDEVQGAVKTQESTGRQDAVNKRTGAAGYFQVMPENVPAWTQKHLNRRMSVPEFMADADAQNRVFRGEFGEYLSDALKRTSDKDTAIRMAAAGWYGGKKRMNRYDDPVRFKADEPSYREYTMGVLNKIGKNQPTPKLDGFLSKLDAITGEQPKADLGGFLGKLDAISGIKDKQGNPMPVQMPPVNPQNAPAPPVGQITTITPVDDSPSVSQSTVQPPPPGQIFDKQGNLMPAPKYDAASISDPETAYKAYIATELDNKRQPLTFEQWKSQQQPLSPSLSQTLPPAVPQKQTQPRPSSRGEFTMTPDVQGEQSDINLLIKERSVDKPLFGNYRSASPDQLNNRVAADTKVNQQTKPPNLPVTKARVAGKKVAANEFKKTGKLTFKVGDTVLTEVPAQDLDERLIRVKDADNETYIINRETGKIEDESLNKSAETIPVTLVPYQNRATMPPDTAKRLQAEEIAAVLAPKYGLKTRDVSDYIAENGFTDLKTGQNLSDDRLYTDRLGGSNKDNYSITRRQLGQLYKSAKEAQTKREDQVLSMIANGQEVGPELLKSLDIDPQDLQDKRYDDYQMSLVKGKVAAEDFEKFKQAYLDRGDNPFVAQVNASVRTGRISTDKGKTLIADFNSNLKAERDQVRKELEQNAQSLDFSPLNSGYKSPPPQISDAQVDQEIAFRNLTKLTEAEQAQAARVGTKLNSLEAGLVGESGRTMESVAGLLRPFAAIPGFKQAYTSLAKQGQFQVLAESVQSDRNDGIVSTIIRTGATLPGFLSRLALFSRLPGGAVVSFALNDATIAAGSGKSRPEITQAGIRGAFMGGVFGIASKAADFLGNKTLGALLKSEGVSDAYLADIAAGTKQIAPEFRNAYIASKIAGETTKLGSIYTGSFAVAKASGATNKDAFNEALHNTIFDLVMTYGGKFANGVAKLSGKFFRFTKDGESATGFVDDKGEINITKKPISDELIDFQLGAKTAETSKTVEDSTPRVQQKTEDMTGVKVVGPDGRRGTVKTDDGTGKGVIVVWEDGRTSQINRKKLTADEGGNGAVTGVLGDTEQSPVDTPKAVENMQNNMQTPPTETGSNSDFNKRRAVTEDENGNLQLKTIETKIPEMANGAENMRNNIPENVQTAPPDVQTEAPKAPETLENKNSEPVQTAPEPVQGEKTVTTERGTKTTVRPKVIEAKDLLTSFDENYPQEYQPRDRSRKASKSQVSDIANKLNPEFLDDSPKASDGRPLVVPVEVDGETKYAVISGNARSEAIRRAYRNESAPSKRYAEFTQSKAPHNLSEPVYVGVLDPAKVDLKKFSREANEAAIAAKSSTEQARTDAESIDSDLMSRFVPSEDGSINSAANRDFIRAFLKRAVPETERNALMSADGRLSKTGVDRITNAILAKTFGEKAVERISETTDSNVRRITNALLQTAGKFLALKTAIGDGVRFDGLDITEPIVRATEKLSFLRDEGTSVEEYLKQQALFGDELSPLERRMLAEFDNYKNSTRAVSGILNNYLALAEGLGNPKEGNLFGEPVEANAATLFKEAVLQYEKGNEPVETQPGLLDADQGRENKSETRPASETTGGESSQTETSTRSEPDKRLSQGSLSVEKETGGKGEGEIFAKNKIFTADRVAAARELLRKKGTQFNIGIDVEQLKALAEIGGAYVEAGIRNFADFSRAMIDEFGKGIKPYLSDIYSEIKSKPEFKDIGLEDLPAEKAATSKAETTKTETVEAPAETQSVTSTKNATVDSDREARGLEPIMKPLVKTWGQAAAEAIAKMDADSGYQDKLINELLNKPRAVSDAENFAILHKKITLRNEAQKTDADIIKAFESGDTFKQTQLTAYSRFISDALLDIDTVTKKVGAELGRGLAARKMMVKEDYSFASLETQKRVALGGRELTAEERADLKKRADDFEKKNTELERNLRERDEELARLRAESQIKPIIRAEHGVSPFILQAAERLVAKIDARADAARARLQKRGYTFNAGINPRDILDLYEIGASYLGHVGLDFARWSDAMIGELGEAVRPYLDQIYKASQRKFDSIVKDKKVKDRIVRKKEDVRQDVLDKIKDRYDEGSDDISGLVQTLAKGFVASGEKTTDGLIDKVHSALKEIDPEMTRREAMDAISGYGKYKQLSKGEVETTLADLKGQMKQIAKLEDMSEGKAPARSGVSRREPSETEKALIKLVKEAERKGNFVQTDPETARRQALASAKTRLQERINELKDSIRQNTPVQKKKGVPVTSPELEALKTEREALQAKYDEVFGSGEMTDEQRLKAATNAVKQSITDIEERIQQKNFDPQTKKPVTSPELDVLRAKRDALRAQYEELRAAADPERTDRIALKAWKTRAAVRIAELERKIADRDFAVSPKKERFPMDTEALKLQFEIDRLKRDFAADLERDRRSNSLKLQLLYGYKTGMDFFRNLTFSGEMSYQVRQAGKFIRSNIVRSTFRRMKPYQTIMENNGIVTKETAQESLVTAQTKGLTALMSHEGFLKANSELEQHPTFAESEAMGVQYSNAGKFNTGQKLGEEELQSESVEGAREWLLNRTSGIGKAAAYIPERYLNVIERFDASMGVTLDTIRLTMYDRLRTDLIEQGFDPKKDRAQFEELAKRINTGTGRPNKFSNYKSQAAVDFIRESKVFGSPSYTVSKWQDLAADARNISTTLAKTLAKRELPLGTQRLAAREALLSYGALMLKYSLVAAATGALMSYDPDDDDYLKLRVPGSDFRYDLTSGNRSELKVIGQFIKRTMEAAGLIKPSGRATLAQNLINYNTYKLHSMIQFGSGEITGKDSIGKEFSRTDPWRYLGVVAPMTWVEAAKITQNYGILSGVDSGAKQFFGYGVSAYPDKEQKSQIKNEVRSGEKTVAEGRKEIIQQLADGTITRKQAQSQIKALTESEAVENMKNLDASTDGDFIKIEDYLKTVKDEDKLSVQKALRSKILNKGKDKSIKAQTDAKKLMSLYRKYFGTNNPAK